MDRLKNSNSAIRLARYRASAEKRNAKYGGTATWRDMKSQIASITATPNNSHGPKGQIYTDSTDQYGDYLGDAHDVARRAVRSEGWYSNQYQDSTIVGGVAKLRTSRGVMYIPVTHNTDCDGTVHYMRDAEIVARGSEQSAHDEAIRDMAIRADQCAEYEAEECREYSAKDQADQDIEQARERIHAINGDALELIREIKATENPRTPAICKALRSQLHGFLADRAEQFRLIDERTDNFWSAVQS